MMQMNEKQVDKLITYATQHCMGLKDLPCYKKAKVGTFRSCKFEANPNICHARLQKIMLKDN